MDLNRYYNIVVLYEKLKAYRCAIVAASANSSDPARYACVSMLVYICDSQHDIKYKLWNCA